MIRQVSIGGNKNPVPHDRRDGIIYCFPRFRATCQKRYETVVKKLEVVVFSLTVDEAS